MGLADPATNRHQMNDGNVFPSVTYNRYIIVTDTLKLLLENTLLHFYQSNIST